MQISLSLLDESVRHPRYSDTRIHFCVQRRCVRRRLEPGDMAKEQIHRIDGANVEEIYEVVKSKVIRPKRLSLRMDLARTLNGYRSLEDMSMIAKESFIPGSVSMANAGPNTNGSLFFICTVKRTIDEATLVIIHERENNDQICVNVEKVAALISFDTQVWRQAKIHAVAARQGAMCNEQFDKVKLFGYRLE
uniref:Uncharacterized protein n=1 Tax=Tanacetum cinerariifolium TaxID=118510 RepID=A0A6L2MTH6_TANCI|nr:hypothetical protein [Tanacetum cinerariifolium]